MFRQFFTVFSYYSFAFRSMWAIIGRLYLLSALCSMAMIHFSFSINDSLFGTCIDIDRRLKFPCCPFKIIIVVQILSKLRSCAAGYRVTLLLAHINVPAPNGVSCLVLSSYLILLCICLSNGTVMCGFLSLYIPVSIIAYASMLLLLVIYFIRSSFFILHFYCGIPLRF